MLGICGLFSFGGPVFAGSFCSIVRQRESGYTCRMPDSAPSRTWTYLFVITFSAIIVALGAHELQHRFAQRGGNVDAKKLVRDLKADPDEMRASLSRKDYSSDNEAKNEPVDKPESPDFQHLLEKIVP